jgi:predicted nucleic acid-binding protein
MREELLRTLAYESLARWKPDRERTLARYDRYARMQPLPAMAPPSLRPSDPDDQIFVDLAVEVKARWLVTHDRSLLRLARAARARGLLILEPADWQAPG